MVRKLSEAQIQREILVNCSDLAALFRTPAGMFWQGKIKETSNGKILTNIRPVKILVPGYSDITGYRRSDGKFVAIEVKRKNGKATKEQLHFIEQVNQSGGLAGIARSVEEARNIILGD